MDFGTEANIIRSMAKIVENGHLHKGSKPVHWCTDCGSALAEAEVEYCESHRHRRYFYIRPRWLCHARLHTI